MYIAIKALVAASADYLVSQGADPNRADWVGQTAVHGAVLKEDEVLLSMLVEAGGDMYQRDEEGEAPLSLLLDSGNFAVSVFETTNLGLRVINQDDPRDMIEILNAPESQETVDRILRDAERMNRNIEEINDEISDFLGLP